MTSVRERRYQVFVSSTYQDLKRERQEVMRVLLELKCIPVGMELFPAASEQQWSLIRREIDQCDYYVLVLGGRYGSQAPDGMGYIEKEYRYALEVRKPVIAFLHRDTGSLANMRTEQTDRGRRKLAAFQKLVRRQLVKYWSSSSDLGRKVSTSLVELIDRHPADGWIRGDSGDVVGGELFGINDCKRDVMNLVADCKSEDELVVHHLGLDMSLACDYVGELMRDCNAVSLEYNILVMAEHAADLGPQPPAEVVAWAAYVPASIERLKIQVRSSVAEIGSRIRNLRIEIRQYTGTPVFHGITISGARRAAYFSVCQFRGPDRKNYDWGEFAYRKVVPGTATASDQHLADTVDGFFADVWNRRSRLRWRFRATAGKVKQDSER